MTAKKKVIIVEDQYLFAKGLKEILSKIKGVEILKIIENGDLAVKETQLEDANIVFLDLNLKGLNGLEVLSELRNKFPKLIIIILTMYQEKVLVEKAKRFGANAYLSKDATEEELNMLMFSANTKSFYIGENILNSNNGIYSEKDNFSKTLVLTTREKEILSYIVKGNTAKEIAEILNISYLTVNTHRKNMQKKLKINKISELVNYAVKNFYF